MRSRTAIKPTCLETFALEARELLTLAGTSAIQPFNAPTITMANVGSDLNAIFNAYVRNVGKASSFPSTYMRHMFRGNWIDVTIAVEGNFNAALGKLEQNRMTVTSRSSNYDLVVGYVPIASLPTISRLPHVGSVNATWRPTLL